MFDDNFVRVEERPLHFESWNDSSIYSTGLGNVKDFKAIVNPETETIISVVGSGYQLVQNQEYSLSMTRLYICLTSTLME